MTEVNEKHPELLDYIDAYSHIISAKDPIKFLKEEWNRLSSLIELQTHQMHALIEVARRKGLGDQMPKPLEFVPEKINRISNETIFSRKKSFEFAEEDISS